MISNILTLENLVEAAARSLFMAGCVGMLLAVMRVCNVTAQKLAWTVVLAAAIAMPFANPWAKAHVDTLPAVLRIDASRFATVAHPIVNQSDPEALPRAVMPPAEPVITDDPRSSSDPIDSHLDVSPQSQTEASAPSRTISFRQVASILYAAVALLLLVRIGHGLLIAMRMWRSGAPLACEGFERLKVRTSRSVTSPVTICSGVLLPAGASQWHERKLQIVLAHEASHVRHGDFYIHLCAEIYAAIFWFSPLGRWLRHKLYALDEALSDGAAVRAAESHATYAQMLIELAATPRTTLEVAMARPKSLAIRIDRLLNESRFRQAFSSSPLRKMLTYVLVPVIACAAAAPLQFIARASTQQAAPVPQTPPVAVTMPAPAGPVDPQQVVPAPAELPPVPAQPSVVPPPQSAAPALARPAAPKAEPPAAVQVPAEPAKPVSVPGVPQTDAPAHASQSYGAYTHTRDGEFYGLFEQHGGNPHFTGTWTKGHADTIEKAQKLAHGDFLLYTDRSGKSFYIDDPEIVMPVKVQYRVMREFSNHSEDFARAQEALKHAKESFAAQKQKPIDKAELQKELSDLNSMLANLKTDNLQSLSPARMQELQSKLGELQGKLALLQVSASFNDANLKFAEKMAELEKHQGQFGWNQGDMSRDAESKMRSAIEQALKSGKAKPVD